VHLSCRLDALRLAAGELGGGLAQTQVAKAYFADHLVGVAYRSLFLEELGGGIDCQA
jgi:hypothetical protein